MYFFKNCIDFFYYINETFFDTYCQLCERFLTKEQWNKPLYSHRFLHKEVNGYCLAIFSNRKVTGYQSSRLGKAFWKIVFAIRYIKEVDKFLIKYFIMVTFLNDYVTNSKEFKEEVSVIVEGHFEDDLYIKSFRNQVKSYEKDTLDQSNVF